VEDTCVCQNEKGKRVSCEEEDTCVS
jgi:hypothetical protein